LILFFSHNSHQDRYFNFLKENLPFEIEVKRVKFSFCKSKDIDLIKKFEELKNKKKDYFLYKEYLKIEAKAIYCYYKKMIEKYSPKIVGIWNGIKYPQFIINEFDVKKLYFENGFLPNTTQADFKGVNFLNSVPRDRAFYEKLNYKPLKLDLVPRAPVKELFGKKIDFENFIFIPLQVNYDSQIIYFSPWIKSMFELIEIVKDIAKKSDLKFVFKAHPSDRVSDYSKIKLSKNIYFATNPTSELIKKAKAVITINSSVGIEALLFKKKVITLGEAFYNIDGIVKHAKNKSELEKILFDIDKFEINSKLIDNFLGYLYYEYLLPSTWKNPSKEHLKKLTSLINVNF
jgi:capsular polysaccharide export protein